MFKQFIETFRKPSADELAARELTEAKRDLLGALSAADYANSVATYNAARIARLQKYISEID